MRDMKPAQLAAVVAASVLISRPLHAQACGDVDEVTGFEVHGISGDGEMMVGQTIQLAAAWTSATGLQSLGVLPNYAHSIAHGGQRRWLRRCGSFVWTRARRPRIPLDSSWRDAGPWDHARLQLFQRHGGFT
jgi:hypothetical protein